ncbi:uroporphyrinogen-III C-methyltransferase [candidate division KSB3 bacterium]|uniref:uroporphyrinogen-III C-methyltransferase n=1 Tax=candidate division KSB3 bacterium TaxID=2044937 RepID=A0A2G6E3Z6_9BACT|nr:MAG: uroporphyrinogen-III C-methyltransferase [candidate division KSB3 bacterium]PIE29321.1 MAG: uroporphyrinogen-III C-methyltransferase [candidate division KSB3 bacterium]
MQTGKVYLVGAGPGDPALLTVKAKDCLEKADAVVYDYLVNKNLLTSVCPQSEQIYVGKKAGRHTKKQEEISALLVDLSRKYSCVVRLKGGDPFVFGRGGEEALELMKHRIPFEIVPGIPAAIAVSAYAGIPLTHRNIASSVVFVTGHEAQKSAGNAGVNWDMIGRGCDTIVIYMGIKRLATIVPRLLASGRDPHTPAAVIRCGTYSSQMTVTGTLENIAQAAEEQQITPPALVVIGASVALREDLAWFDRRPLFGQRVLVTRNACSEGKLTQLLEAQGAEVLSFPTIEVVAITDNPRFDNALNKLEDYDYLLFTSGNAVDMFFRRLFQLGDDVRALRGVKIVAIGRPGLERLHAYSLHADVLPAVSTSEKMVDELLASHCLTGKHLLFPRSDLSAPATAERLRQAGAVVDDIPVYENRLARMEPERVERLKSRILAEALDWISFTSSSTVTNFLTMLGADFLVEQRRKFRIISIGPVTTGTLMQNRLEPEITADEHSFQGLVTALINGTR